MNPPFSNPTPWVDRFLAHGHGVALLPCSKARWFERVWSEAPAIAFPGTRLSEAFAIYMPTFLAACGEDCVAAIGRTGPVR